MPDTWITDMRHYLGPAGRLGDMPAKGPQRGALSRLSRRLGDQPAFGTGLADQRAVPEKPEATAMPRGDPCWVRSHLRGDHLAVPGVWGSRAHQRVGRNTLGSAIRCRS